MQLTTNFAFYSYCLWLKKCEEMDHIVLSSSSDEGTPLLDKAAEKHLEGELDMAEKLMHELEGDGSQNKGKKKPVAKTADAKKLKVKNGGVKKEKKPPAAKPQKKVVKKEKGSPAKIKAKIESSGEEDDGQIESDSDVSSDDPEMPGSTVRMNAKDRKKAEKAKKETVKFNWIKTGHLPGGFMQFGQCQTCGDEQKALDEVIGQDSGGLFARIIQCRDCLNCNRKIREIQQKLVSGTEKTPAGNFEFVPESDDYKCATLVYCRQIGQCQYCQRKQLKMEPTFEKVGHGHVALKIAVCSLCAFMNKSIQKMFWDGFSSWNKKGGRGAKKNKKRGRKFESSSSESTSGSESDDEPTKKKKKMPMKKAAKKTKKWDDDSDDE